MGTKETVETNYSKTAAGLTRFWVGWGSKLKDVDTAFSKWIIRGQRMPFSDDVIYSYAAIVDAVDREGAWHQVVEAFGDADEAFVKKKPSNYWPPADRFPKAS